jgi:ABC-type branched-subunit amino acid transport system permease subunit
VAWLSYIMYVLGLSVLVAYSTQLACNYLFKFKPNFKLLFLLALGSLLVSAFAVMAFNFVTSSSSELRKDSGFIAMVTSFLVTLVLNSKFIKQPDSINIEATKALKLFVISTIIQIFLFLLLALVLVVFFNVLR